MEEYDVCILGCGPGGFAAAMRCYDFDKHVLIIEGSDIGGAGVMHGALTSKTMWELSRDYASAGRVDRGYRSAGLQVDYAEVKNTVIQAAKDRQYQMLSQIESFAKGKSKTKSITYLRGWGKFRDKNTLEVKKPGGHPLLVKSKYTIIATGSQPRRHPFLEIDGKRIVDSNSVLNLKTFPKRLMIIGAGIVGCEFATIFGNYAQTEVHILDQTNRVIAFEDEDVSTFVEENLVKLGVKFHHQATLREVRKFDDFIQVVLDYKSGHTKVIEVDVILISIGRVPNTQKLGLKNVGIQPSESGHLQVDSFCRMVDNIYAVGDISARTSALVNVAEMEGRFAAKSIAHKVKYPLRYANMPIIMFFKPEIAAVGKNEKQCQKEKIAYKVAYYSNGLNTRAISMRNTNGFIKLIVTHETYPKILGMRAAGPQASAVIMSIALLMDQDKHLNEIMKTVHPHPSVTEGIQECIRVLMNKSIYKPQAFPEYIKLKTWSP